MWNVVLHKLSLLHSVNKVLLAKQGKHITKKNIIITKINWNYVYALRCNGVRQQNILVLYNQHNKQSQHVSHTDVVDQSLQGLFIPLVLFAVLTGSTTTRPERVFTTTGSPLDKLSKLSHWLFAENEDCATGDWKWCINTDELLSSVNLYPCCRLLAWLLAAANEHTCFDVHRRIVSSSNCISYDLKGSVCLTVPFRPIIHCSVGVLGSALPSTLYSNHALSNLRTAWQYSQMSYRMLNYIDFVNALTYSPT